MTRFRREGHWRWRNGRRHWVSSHSVERTDWDRYSTSVDWEWSEFSAGRNWPRRYLDEGEPNAVCPVCGADVWFFRNDAGGCAYFDSIGRPWPKHPCMDSRRLADRTAAWQARAAFNLAYEEDEGPFTRDARTAYTAWALALLDLHVLQADLRQQQGLVKRALAATRSPASGRQTSRQRRDNLRRRRARLSELTSLVGEAKTRLKEAKKAYEDELQWTE